MKEAEQYLADKKFLRIIAVTAVFLESVVYHSILIHTLGLDKLPAGVFHIALMVATVSFILIAIPILDWVLGEVEI